MAIFQESADPGKRALLANLGPIALTGIMFKTWSMTWLKESHSGLFLVRPTTYFVVFLLSIRRPTDLRQSLPPPLFCSF